MNSDLAWLDGSMGWLIIFIPAIGGLLVGLLVKYGAPEIKGHGVPEVMEATLTKGGRIRPRVGLLKALASAITIGSGGSAGREGPIIAIGSSAGSAIAQYLNLSDEKIRILLGSIPCRTDQVYYTVSNLNAAEPRDGDPAVYSVCSDGSRYELNRFIARSFGSLCEEFPVYRQVAIAEGVTAAREVDDFPQPERQERSAPHSPPTHGFLDPCGFEEGDVRTRALKRPVRDYLG